MDGAEAPTTSQMWPGSARTLRIGDLVREMLEASFNGLLKDDPALETVLSGLDDRIGALQQSVKLYVARLDRDALDDQANRRANEIISYAINLEHIGESCMQYGRYSKAIPCPCGNVAELG